MSRQISAEIGGEGRKKELKRGGNLDHTPDAERLIDVVVGWMWKIWQHLVVRLQITRRKLHFLNCTHKYFQFSGQHALKKIAPECEI